MAFAHGKSTRILLGSSDLSAYFRSAEYSGSNDVAETTTFTKSAKTYIPGLNDGTVSLDGLFDATADATVQALIGAADGSATTVAVEGLAVGTRVKLLSARGTEYTVSAPVGDVVAANLSLQADGGIDAGHSFADLAARTATANGTSVDNGASTTNGWSATLHVTAASGTTPTLDVKFQDSADDASWLDLSVATFTQVTAAGSQYITGTGTVRRYVRAVWTIGGTTPSFTFTTAFARR